MVCLSLQFRTMYIPKNLLGGTETLSRYGVRHFLDNEWGGVKSVRYLRSPGGYLVLGLLLRIISWIFFELSWPFGRET